MFGGKKEKALQDDLYTIKRQIAEYSDELKEDSVQMTASRVQMEENIEILEEKLECVGELAEESCRTGKELYSTFVEVHNAVESFEANHSIFIGQVAEQNEKIKEVILGCLLHDGSEVYLSDVTRPIKKELTYYLEVEDVLQNVIWKHFIQRDLTKEETKLVFEIDDEMLSLELKELLNDEINRNYLKLQRKVDLSFVAFETIENEFIEKR